MPFRRLMGYFRDKPTVKASWPRLAPGERGRFRLSVIRRLKARGLHIAKGHLRWPISRVLSPAEAGWRSSIWDAGYPAPQAAYPRHTGRATLGPSPYGLAPRLCLALLPVGFAKPARSPEPLVVSYTTFSPLPRLSEAVCFLWHFPSGHPAWALPSTVLCGARTFLTGAQGPCAIAWPPQAPISS